jgi:hypothetical protein
MWARHQPISRFLQRQLIGGACAITPIALLEQLQLKGIVPQFQTENYGLLRGTSVILNGPSDAKNITLVNLLANLRRCNIKVLKQS